ncbi:MAG: tetratricopeptide repeat protein [Coleofasciculaceae cyanobacterium RL_1_1]|nr:tetratricopeptide repeat protein [Coleofasciculaceae cyanobacterium RL_1_1]
MVNLDRVERDRLAVQALSLQIEEVQAQIARATGQPEVAAEQLQILATNYTQLGDLDGLVRVELARAQALQDLGLYRRSLTLLLALTAQLDAAPDISLAERAMKRRASLALGNTLRAVGERTGAAQMFEQALALAIEDSQAWDETAAVLGLGELAQAIGDRETARGYYDRAITIAPDTATQIRAELHRLELDLSDVDHDFGHDLDRGREFGDSGDPLIGDPGHVMRSVDDLVNPVADRNTHPAINPAINQTMNPTMNQTVNPAIHQQISSLYQRIQHLPTDRDGLATRIQFARQILNITDRANDAAKLLATAAQIARTTRDRRIESDALGSLGHLYEQQQRWQEAAQLTQQALVVTETLSAADLTYQWYWQLGRIHQAQNQRPAALAAYAEAVKSLGTLRADLVSVSTDVQFSFREKVEPVYRERVNLLLDRSAEISQADLRQARDTIEQLQLAELDNYFAMPALMLNRRRLTTSIRVRQWCIPSFSPIA